MADPTTAESVQALDLPGIGTAYDQRRDEPGHDLAANLIGFTGNDSAGLAGLEEAYNKQLQGVDGSHTYVFNLRSDLSERNDLARWRQDIAHELYPLLTSWEASVDADAAALNSTGGGGGP